MTAVPEPMTLPSDEAGWIASVTTDADARIARAKELLAQLKDGTPRDTAATLELWNDLTHAMRGTGGELYLISECHPSAAVRDAATERYAAVDALGTEVRLDRALWQVFDALDPAGLDGNAQRLLAHTLRDFRLAGVDRDDEVRARIRELADRETELSLAFSKNVREGRRQMQVAQTDLDGLPADFLEAHPADDEGLVTLTTDYPDLMPVREYAKNRAVRLAMTDLQNGIAWEENAPVLAELLQARQEHARLLGLEDWADVETATRMAGSSRRVAQFLEDVDEASAPTMAAEYDVLLARLREDDPTAQAVTTADFSYLVSTIKREQYDVDAQEVRSYFPYERVLEGVLGLTGELLGLRYLPVDVPTWHEDVLAYDVQRDGARIGRIYLDMHPREGKYNHAACFDIAVGMAGRELPEGVLLCNFNRGLLEHDEVTTFLHEFGHLVHAIVGGHQRFIAQSGIATEWDFVEAPSQMLEEWAWDADVLAGFARNAAGESIPADLVERMRTADAFGRVLGVRRQLGLAQVAYRLHADVPDDIEGAVTALLEGSTPVRTIPGGGRFAANFGHLTGYGACYYTYQWSLVIARDLLTGFGDDLMDAEAATRYRDLVLAPGGTKDAADLVADFLGRPYTTDAYRAWLAGA